MALVNVIGMNVLDNPTNFLNPFQFEITFECLEELNDDLEWKVLYVGKAEDYKSDIVLDEILVGPVPVGVNKFLLQADAPPLEKLPQEDILGVTVVLVTCSFKEREFVRVGYYVNNEYTGEYDAEKGPPKPYDLTKITRQILADKPRVTKMPIPWGKQDDETMIGVVAPSGEEAEEEEESGADVGVNLNEMITTNEEEEEEEEEEEGGDDAAEVDLEEEEETLVPTVSSE